MERILLVDDEIIPETTHPEQFSIDEMADMLRECSLGKNYELVTAHDVKEARAAIDAARNDRRYFAVVVTDMHMPKDRSVSKDPIRDAGLEVAMRALEVNPYTRVIVITAYAEGEVGNKAMKMGAFYFDKAWVRNIDFLNEVIETHADDVCARRGEYGETFHLIEEAKALLAKLSNREVELACIKEMSSIYNDLPGKLRVAHSQLKEGWEENDPKKHNMGLREVNNTARHLASLFNTIRNRETK